MDHNPIWILSWITHDLLILLFAPFLVKKQHPNEKGVVLWIIWLSLFIPVAGEILGWLTWWMAKKTSVHHDFSFEKHAFAEAEAIEALNQDASADIRLTSLVNALEMEGSGLQKELIMRLPDADIRNHGSQLRAALEIKDTEIVHYAAATINMLQDRYEHNISAAKEQLMSGRLKDYQRIIGLYENYIDSGVMHKPFEVERLRDYRSLLEKAVAQFPEQAEFYFHLGRLLERLNEPNRAINVYQTMIERFPRFYGGYLGLIQSCFERHEWHGIRELIQLMRQHVGETDIPQAYRDVIRALEGI